MSNFTINLVKSGKKCSVSWGNSGLANCGMTLLSSFSAGVLTGNKTSWGSPEYEVLTKELCEDIWDTLIKKEFFNAIPQDIIVLSDKVINGEVLSPVNGKNTLLCTRDLMKRIMRGGMGSFSTSPIVHNCVYPESKGIMAMFWMPKMREKQGFCISPRSMRSVDATRVYAKTNKHRELASAFWNDIDSGNWYHEKRE